MQNKANGGEAMGNFGRITTLTDLPSDKIIHGLIMQAIKLNENKIRVPVKPKVALKTVIIPEYFINVLKKNKLAFTNFNAFAKSHKKEYVNWIAEAKTEETRNKRILTAIEWLTQNKDRNWKYK